MTRILLLAALVLFVLALICAITPTTIAGASYPTWAIAGFIAWVLDQLVGAYVK